MNSVSILAEEIRSALETAHPNLRKTIAKKLPLLVAVMLETKTANTTELATALPIATTRIDMRLQWIARLLGNPLLMSNRIIEPFAHRVLEKALEHDPNLVITMVREAIGDRFTLVMVNALIGNQVFPLAWRADSTTEELGRYRRSVLERVAEWLPKNAKVRLIVDQEPLTEEMLLLIQKQGWQYRCFLDETFPIASGERTRAVGDVLKEGVSGGALLNAPIFSGKTTTDLVLIPATKKSVMRVMATNCASLPEETSEHWPTPVGVDTVFAAFKGNGSSLRATHLHYAIRIDHMVLLMALALYWRHQTDGASP